MAPDTAGGDDREAAVDYGVDKERLLAKCRAEPAGKSEEVSRHDSCCLLSDRRLMGRWRFTSALSLWLMKTSSQLTKIEMLQNFGFLGILILCFLDDLLQLPSLIFSDHPFAFAYRRSTLDMLLVLLVWFLVSRSTHRILARIQYLEKFMRVCAWCRRIHFKGEWVPLEEFLRQSFDTPTTHGICKDCLERQQAAINRAKLARKQAARKPETDSTP